MTPQLKSGVLAGGAAAALILIAALAMRSGLVGVSIILFSLGLLPVLLAGLRLGANTAGMAAVVASLVTGLAAGPVAGLVYALVLGGPGYVLSYLAGLHRVADNTTSEQADDAPENAVPAIEWYPLGHIIAWTAVMAGLISVLGVLALGQSEDSYLAAVKPQLEKFMPAKGMKPKPDDPAIATPPAAKAPQPSGMSREETLNFLARAFVPASVAIGWFVTALFNLWVAAALLRRSSALPRNWPNIARFEFPRFFSLGVMAAIFASLLPGLPGIFAAGFTGGFFFGYLLLGLAVLHVITSGMTLRPVVLGAIYLSVLFLQIGIFVMLLGIGEQIFRLRNRMQPT